MWCVVCAVSVKLSCESLFVQPSSCSAKQLLVEDVVRLHQQYKQEPEARFVLLMLWEKTHFASFGHTVCVVAEKLQLLSLEAQEDTNIPWEDGVTSHSSGKFHELVDILMDCSSGHEVLYFVNRNGVTVAALIEVLSSLEKLRAEACRLVGDGCVHISEVLAVAQPLLEEANPSVASVYPLIELKRKSPNVYIRDTTSKHFAVCFITFVVCFLFLVEEQQETYHEFEGRFARWVEAHPGVFAYLDPPMILIEPVALLWLVLALSWLRCLPLFQQQKQLLMVFSMLLALLSLFSVHKMLPLRTQLLLPCALTLRARVLPVELPHFQPHPTV